MFNDVLVIGKNDGTFAAKLTDESGNTTWINGGGITNDGRILIGERGHLVDLALDREAVAEFREDRNSGVENAHHKVVGRGRVDGEKANAFFDSSGTYISLKPTISEAEAVSIADQF